MKTTIHYFRVFFPFQFTSFHWFESNNEIEWTKPTNLMKFKHSQYFSIKLRWCDHTISTNSIQYCNYYKVCNEVHHLRAHTNTQLKTNYGRKPYYINNAVQWVHNTKMVRKSIINYIHFKQFHVECKLFFLIFIRFFIFLCQKVMNCMNQIEWLILELNKTKFKVSSHQSWQFHIYK